jgi:hypothetical protein
VNDGIAAVDPYVPAVIGVVERAIVPVEVIVPPESPVPAITLVTVPDDNPDTCAVVIAIVVLVAAVSLPY